MKIFVWFGLAVIFCLSILSQLGDIFGEEVTLENIAISTFDWLANLLDGRALVYLFTLASFVFWLVITRKSSNDQ
jgi:hypothetical protein